MEIESLKLEKAFAIKERLKTLKQIRELQEKLQEEDEYIAAINANIEMEQK